MKRKYVIRCSTSTPIGFITETLTVHDDWAVATAIPAAFKSPREAAAYFAKAKDIPLRGSSVWIEGPMGGRYSHTGRKL